MWESVLSENERDNPCAQTAWHLQSSNHAIWRYRTLYLSRGQPVIRVSVTGMDPVAHHVGGRMDRGVRGAC